MAKKPTRPARSSTTAGPEARRTSKRAARTVLTTNQGMPIADNQNSLAPARAARRCSKTSSSARRSLTSITSAFPSGSCMRAAPARTATSSRTSRWAKLTRAAFLQDPKAKTPVFVRFSTVAGGAGSGDMPRDVRGFAVKFYTEEGNFDLVGNNIPVFFIQDAIKFPDLIHAVKMEPDRGFPQAATAHDTFWDFISLMPESMHMIMWAMSDRTLPRSLRMMEGFGVHTFRLVNAAGRVHLREVPLAAEDRLRDARLGRSGEDQRRRSRLPSARSARRDRDGRLPGVRARVQAFDEKTAARFPFDVLDATKLIPEEMVPLQPVGRMVLDRNADNFFAETEQVAFHPGNIVPGIDFTNDPLLQGRLFSYTDTQLLRLGGANFHEIPINRPKCPMRNFQRDGVRRMDVEPGQVAYEPNSLAPDAPREDPRRGFTSHPALDAGDKLRERVGDFADHYSQPRLFFRSMTEPEQRHIVSAFTFELSKVSTVGDSQADARTSGEHRCRGSAQRVARASAWKAGGEDRAGAAADRHEAVAGPEPGRQGAPTLEGRKVGVLVTDGSDGRSRPGAEERPSKKPARGCRSSRRRWRRQAGEWPDAAGRPSARRRSVDPVRCCRGRGVGTGSRVAAEGGGRDRLVARCLRPPEGHRDRRGRGAAAGNSRD